MSSGQAGVKEQQALNEYLESLDPKKLLREFQKEKEREEKRREDDQRRQRKMQRKEEKEKRKKIAQEEKENLSASASPKPGRSSPEGGSSKEEVKKPPRGELPLTKSIIPVLLYNVEICTAVISCYISEGKHHALADGILDLFSANRVEQKLIMHCLSTELESNQQQSALFRDNTPGTALLTSYCKKKGQPLIKELLEPFLQEILALPLALELDENRCTPEEAAGNVPLLADLVERILNDLYLLADKLPSSLRSVFQYLQRTVLLKYPDMNTRIVGGFFFLRFFCPMLVAPERYGITKKPVPASGRRTLVLVTKVIQNISNRIEFGKGTEAYMLPLNDLVKKHIPLMAEFLSTIADPPEDGSYYLPKADTRKPDGEIHSVQPDQLYLIVSKIAEIPNRIVAHLPTEESVQTFRNFHNKVLRDVHEAESIGWVPFEIPKEEPAPEPPEVEFDGVSRSAFLLMREALAQAEDELREMRHKLEEERILRQSMQHIIVNIADSIHFQIDERVRIHVENITKRSADPSVGENFCQLLERRSVRCPERPPLPQSDIPDIPVRPTAGRARESAHTTQSFAPAKPLPAAPGRAPRPNSLGAPSDPLASKLSAPPPAPDKPTSPSFPSVIDVPVQSKPLIEPSPPVPVRVTSPTPPARLTRPRSVQGSPIPPAKPERLASPVPPAKPPRLEQSTSPRGEAPGRPGVPNLSPRGEGMNRRGPASAGTSPRGEAPGRPGLPKTNVPPQERPLAQSDQAPSANAGGARMLKPSPAGRGKPRLSPRTGPPPFAKSTSTPQAHRGRPLPQIPPSPGNA